MAPAEHRQVALKLEVPWRGEPIPVNFNVNAANYDTLTRRMEASCGQHLQPDGDSFRVTNFFGETNIVPDAIRYRIGEEGCCALDNDGYHICNDRYLVRQQPGSIVLLLESPHMDEYRNDAGEYNIASPQAPARGSTGTNIDSCLGTVLSRIAAGLNVADLIVPERHIIISNPIPFQTSLHAIHSQSVRVPPWNTLRNNVWKTLWREEHIKQCFLARLKAYNPCLIINACTYALKSYVRSFVQGVLPDVPRYKTHHPADRSWDNCNIDPEPDD